MPKNSLEVSPEILAFALTGIDLQIAQLQEKRVQVAALIAGESVAPVASPPATQASKQRVMSAAAREKISAAVKARWARDKQAQAKGAKSKPAVATEGKPKGRPKGKKAATKKKAVKTAAPAEVAEASQEA